MNHPPSAHTALLLAIDPIVQAYTVNESPCGDPMGNDYYTKKARLSEVVRDKGWEYAFDLPETKLLLANIGAPTTEATR